MMKSNATKVFLLLLILLATNAEVFLFQDQREVYFDNDEIWYGIVLQQYENKSCDMGIPLTFEHNDRKDFHSCGFYKWLNFLSPFKSYFEKTIYLRFLGRFLTLLLLCLLSQMITGNFLFGAVVGGWYLLDSGFTAYKPLLLNILDLVKSSSHDLIRTSRFISPLHYNIPILGLIFAFIRSIQLQKWNIPIVIVFIISAYFLSLTPFYVFLPALMWCGSLWLYSIYFSNKNTKIQLSAFLLIMLGLIALQLLPKMGLPYQEEALLRSSFIKGYFKPIFLLHKTLILVTLLWLPILFKYFRGRWLPSLLVGLGPYILLNINIVTGIEFQNFHFKDYLALPMFGVISIYLFKNLWLKKSMIIISVVGIFIGAIHSIQAQKSRHVKPDPTFVSRQFYDLVDYLNQIPGEKKLFCHDLYQILPLNPDNRCFWHHLLMTYSLSDKELMYINVASFHLKNIDQDELHKIFDKEIHNGKLAVNSYGSLPEWSVGIPNHEKYADQKNLTNLYEKWAIYYQENKDEITRKYLKDFDYLVFPKDESKYLNELDLVKDFENYSLYKPKK